MGQYFYAVIYQTDSNNKKIIRICINPLNCSNGMKLMEHSYFNNIVTSLIELLLIPTSPFYKSNLVWAGDYCEDVDEEDKNLHNMCENDLIKERTNNVLKNITKEELEIVNEYDYILNHTKKQYIDKKDHKKGEYIHPLPLLTADSNGYGMGDFKGNDEDLCGSWKGDIISVEKEIPIDYTKFECNFVEE